VGFSNAGSNPASSNPTIIDGHPELAILADFGNLIERLDSGKRSATHQLAPRSR